MLSLTRSLIPSKFSRMMALLAVVLLATVLPANSASAAPAYVGSATLPGADGYWLVTAGGEVSSYGNARHFGHMAGKGLNKPIVGMAATPSGAGYWLVAGDGGIFAFGDAKFFGSTGSIKLNKPIVGMTSTPSALGYWMVASDGGIFAYGDAAFYGSTGAMTLNKPVVGMTAATDGKGYWMVASDGGIFAFGAASFHGSTGSIKLNKPVVGMSTSQSGHGYWLVAEDGGIFAFGDAPFLGAGDSSAPTITIVPDSVGGYLVVNANGRAVRKSRPFVSSPVVTSPVVTTPAPTTSTTAAPAPTTTAAPVTTSTTVAAPTTVPREATTTTAPRPTTTVAPTTTTAAPVTSTTAPPVTTTTVPATTTTTTAAPTTTTTAAPTTTTTAVPAVTSFNVNFQTADGVVPTGYTGDFGMPFDGTAGWMNSSGVPTSFVGNGRVRNVLSDARLDSFMHMQMSNGGSGVAGDATWTKRVANGTYDVTIGVGDANYVDSRNVIRLEGTKVLEFTPTSGNTNYVTTARISVNDGLLTVDAVGGSNTKIGFIDLRVATGPAPTPTPTVAPTTTTAPVGTTTSSTTSTTTSTTVPGSTTGPWTQIFNDDFNTNTPRGSFLNTYGSKWGAYQYGWLDTSKRGTYDPSILSVENGNMNMNLHTTSDGKHHVAAPFPKLPGGENQLYGRYEVRFRADAVDGYKTAWLLWPKSEVWPRDGEVDFPEGDLTGRIGAFMHRQGATSGGDQDHFSTNARYTDWHTATLEWMPGRINFILDGVTIGSSTSRIPNTPMHWVLQTETKLSGAVPNDTSGNVQIDRVTVWKYTG